MTLIVNLEERIVYRNEVIIEKPEGKTDDEFKDMVREAASKCNSIGGLTTDFVRILMNDYDIKVVEELVSGEVDESNFEITDMADID